MVQSNTWRDQTSTDKQSEGGFVGKRQHCKLDTAATGILKSETILRCERT